MKKHLPLYLLLLLIFASCGREKAITTTLQADIKGIMNDTLYLFGTDKYYDRVDTLLFVDGKLSIELPIDTLVPMQLQLPGGELLPLFVGKGDKLSITGKFPDSLAVSGNPLNNELQDFNQTLANGHPKSARQIQDSVAQFISTHPFSLVSIYLLDKYFVQASNPNVKRIQKLIDSMSGELKDRPYIIELNEQLGEDALMEEGKLAPYFRVKDAEGNTITRTKYNKQYLLINFWASWDEASCQENQVLKRIYKKYKKRKDFAMLGISLDVDKEQWEQMVSNDTLSWNQGIEVKSWQSEIVKQYGINQLPTNILLNTAGRVEKINITEAELETYLKEVDSKEAARKKKRK